MEGNVPNFNRNLQTWLLAITSAAAVGTFTFLWNLNANFAIMKQEIVNEKQQKDQLQNNMNNLQLDVRDIREKVIRLEVKNR